LPVSLWRNAFLGERFPVEGVVGVALGPCGAFPVERGWVRFIEWKTVLPAADEIGVGDGGPANDYGICVSVSDKGDCFVAGGDDAEAAVDQEGPRKTGTEVLDKVT